MDLQLIFSPERSHDPMLKNMIGMKSPKMASVFLEYDPLLFFLMAMWDWSVWSLWHFICGIKQEVRSMTLSMPMPCYQVYLQKLS